MEITSNDYILVCKSHRQGNPFKPYYCHNDDYDKYIMNKEHGLERIYVFPENIQISNPRFSLYKVIDAGKALLFAITNIELVEKPTILD
jgi:hypothetical protein